MSDTTLVGGAEETLMGENAEVKPVENSEVAPVVAPVEEAKLAEDTTDSKADEVKVGAPEKYEDFNLPEGMSVEDSTLESFIPLAKELNLDQGQAQRLVDYEAGRVQEMINTQEQVWADLRQEWRTATKSDKEIGGPAFDESLAAGKTFLREYGTPELLEALNSTGMGDHPEFIRAFARAGKAMKEDALSTGGPGEAKLSAEEILYPNQTST